MSAPGQSFPEVFQHATGHDPYPYQIELATRDDLSRLLSVPTGLGKTAAAVLAWLWRRRFAPEPTRHGTPRRLVYCLPMRVLVEQTEKNIRQWLENLGLDRDVPVYRLMGGEEEEDWDLYPERDAVLVGTQDMLLSRALNRGYAASRARWPMHFGLLNNDCLWVFDEVQLMGSGLATTAQLHAFRSKLAGPKAPNTFGCSSLWMSATLDPQWLDTVDLPRASLGQPLELTAADINDPRLEARRAATKPLAKAPATIGEDTKLARKILAEHKPGTLTLVVVNTIRRAVTLYEALQKDSRKSRRRDSSAFAPSGTPERVLIHSRFRPAERRRIVDQLLAPPGPGGTIVVSTQVVEAGVDISAATLFTELAPWPSLVQRFGRCNRDGNFNSIARVYWIDLPDKGSAKLAAPYDEADLQDARRELEKLSDVAIDKLPNVPLKFRALHVIRARDVLELFDTTPDLAGNDLDIDRFVRDIEESDVRVFWRDWDPQTAPPRDLPAYRAEELCSAPLGEFREFLKNHGDEVWRWDFREGTWRRAGEGAVVPGQVFLIRCEAGGYRPDRGWDPTSSETVSPLEPSASEPATPPDATEAERFAACGRWQSIAEHTQELCDELAALLERLGLSGDCADALRHAARWHDRGKAHAVFQAALPEGQPSNGVLWAKAASEKWNRYGRRFFRHELASALAVLLDSDQLVPDKVRDLVAYLVAAHHGKVRLSIRSLPEEQKPGDDRRFARGVWDGDELPPTDLGGGVAAPAVKLSLEPMEMGLCTEPPFVGQPSWADRMIRLRNELGPFGLAYLEALLRAADMRVSRGPAPIAGNSGSPIAR